MASFAAWPSTGLVCNEKTARLFISVGRLWWKTNGKCVYQTKGLVASENTAFAADPGAGSSPDGRVHRLRNELHAAIGIGR